MKQMGELGMKEKLVNIFKMLFGKARTQPMILQPCGPGLAMD